MTLETILEDDDTQDRPAWIDDLFKPEPCPYRPMGHWVVVQERVTPEKTKAGIYIPDEVRDLDKAAQSVGCVISVGPQAGYDELTGESLPGWPWFEPGDFVLIPKHSSARYQVGQAVFRLVKAGEIFAQIEDIERVRQ